MAEKFQTYDVTYTGQNSGGGDLAEGGNRSDHTYCLMLDSPNKTKGKNGLEGSTKSPKKALPPGERDFSKENNELLRLAMDTLLSINKSTRRNTEPQLLLKAGLIRSRVVLAAQ